MRFLPVFLLAALPLNAAVVGTNVPVKSLTRARVMALPARKRAPWIAYIERSEKQMAADKASFAKEREGMTQLPPQPKQGYSARSIPLDKPADWYASDEAKKLGAAVISFQTPNGGWSKNLDFAAGSRVKGESYFTANVAPTAVPPTDFDRPADETWHYFSTLDNDATNTEIHFLAKLAQANPGAAGEPYRKAITRGVEYLLASQFPNGGWPQVWPLEGGYHDMITYNDDAVTESAEVLTLAAAAKIAQPDGELVDGVAAEDYTFLTLSLRARCNAAVAKANRIILATQIKVNGKLTVWAQQNDPLTLEAASARNFEMPALSSGESASVVRYLMFLPKPTSAEVQSIDAAVAWFEANKIVGFTWSGGRGTPGGRKLTAKEGAGPLWARYYSLTTGKAVFGDRDKSIHDDVMEISDERRNGYGWFGGEPEKVLQRYGAWMQQNGRNGGANVPRGTSKLL